jgi:hypothetical protein
MKRKLIVLGSGLLLALAGCAGVPDDDSGTAATPPPVAQAAPAEAPAPAPESEQAPPPPPPMVVDPWDMPQVAANGQSTPITSVDVDTPPHYNGVPEPEYVDPSGKDCYRTWDEEGHEHAICVAPPAHGRRHSSSYN